MGDGEDAGHDGSTSQMHENDVLRAAKHASSAIGRKRFLESQG